ncbi:MAG: CehA/McbA family metallohydrolase, partial [Planctomycetota bacterium]
ALQPGRVRRFADAPAGLHPPPMLSARLARRLRFGPRAAVAAGPCSSAAAQFVSPPAGWYSVDSHVHVQQCPGVTGKVPPNLTLEEVYQLQQAGNLDVAFVLLRNSLVSALGQELYFQDFAPLITGLEESVTQPDADHEIRYGFEVSGFPAQDLGHIHAIGVTSGFFPNLSWPGPILDWLESGAAGPDPLIGYAHVRWHEGLPPLAIGQIAHTGSELGIVHSALGRIDFVEASFLDPIETLGPLVLYEGLLATGLRTSLIGGSDNSCLALPIGGIRSFVQTGGASLSFDELLDGIREGRTTTSIGGEVFLGMELNGARMGEDALLEAGEPATLKPDIHVLEAFEGVLEIRRNGVPISSSPFSAQPGQDPFPDGIAIDVPESAFITARVLGPKGVVSHAFASAIYALVDRQPIASGTLAQYWRSILLQMIAEVDYFDQLPAEDSAALVVELRDAVTVLNAYLALADDPPATVERLGHSTNWACRGPLAMGVTGPVSQGTAGFAFTCVNAPDNASGLLAVSTGTVPAGASLISGITAFIDSPLVLVPVQANAGGYASWSPSIPAVAIGLTFSGQFVFDHTQGCGVPGQLAASDALVFQIVP